MAALTGTPGEGTVFTCTNFRESSQLGAEQQWERASHHTGQNYVGSRPALEALLSGSEEPQREPQDLAGARRGSNQSLDIFGHPLAQLPNAQI